MSGQRWYMSPHTGRVYEVNEAARMSDATIATFRPVVVIDPEDREQVERLSIIEDAVYGRLHPEEYAAAPEIEDDEDVELLQAVLREFANPKPPKPDEPTGLGAVVEDADGVLWVLAGVSHNGLLRDNWRPATGDYIGYWQSWDHIDAVRVLSEGVPES